MAQTTQYSRGTSGYRAPELITEITNRYTNKVDIFAVGCIFFELVFRTKAFRDDFAVRQYALASGERLVIPATSDACPDERRRELISQTIYQMIHIDPLKRPRAHDLCMMFGLEATNLSTQSSSTSLPEMGPPQNYDLRVPEDGKI